MRNLLSLTFVLLVILAGTTGQTASATSIEQNRRVAKRAVCHFFKSNCETAMRIVKCETGGIYSVWASNGQYFGIFQMGSSERARFGHGNNVWAQAKAAYAYFKVAGFGPWLNYEPPGCGN